MIHRTTALTFTDQAEIQEWPFGSQASVPFGWDVGLDEQFMFQSLE